MRSFQYHAGHYGANDKNRFEFSRLEKLFWKQASNVDKVLSRPYLLFQTLKML